MNTTVPIPCITGIYLITHIESKRPYVGFTGAKTGFRGRWKDHIYSLLAQTHSSKHLQRAWNKYGEEAFDFSVCVYIPQGNMDRPTFFKFLKQEEVRILRLYPDNFNGTEAGDGGMLHTEETKIRMRASIKKAHADPKIKAIKSKASREWMAIATNRELISKKAKEGWNRLRADKERLAVRNAAISNSLKERNAKDPEGVVKRTAHFKTTQHRTAQSERSKKLWSDPEYRKMMEEKRNARNSLPEFKARLSKESRAYWDSPGAREECSKRSKEMHRKRNASKLKPFDTASAALPPDPFEVC
jgi:hypothetical protein